MITNNKQKSQLIEQANKAITKKYKQEQTQNNYSQTDLREGLKAYFLSDSEQKEEHLDKNTKLYQKNTLQKSMFEDSLENQKSRLGQQKAGQSRNKGNKNKKTKNNKHYKNIKNS